MKLTEDEIVIFLVGLSLGPLGHSAESIRIRLQKKYGLEVSRKRIYDILSYMHAQQYLDRGTTWGRHNQRYEYRPKSEPQAD